MDFISIHIAASSPDEGRKIAHALVEEKLVACVNIVPQVQSIYRWQGKVEEAAEVLLIAKTRAALFNALALRVKELHSYDCPCIVALPITEGDATYLDWVAQETKAGT